MQVWYSGLYRVVILVWWGKRINPRDVSQTIIGRITMALHAIIKTWKHGKNGCDDHSTQYDSMCAFLATELWLYKAILRNQQHRERQQQHQKVAHRQRSTRRVWKSKCSLVQPRWREEHSKTRRREHVQQVFSGGKEVQRTHISHYGTGKDHKVKFCTSEKTKRDRSFRSPEDGIPSLQWLFRIMEMLLLWSFTAHPLLTSSG